MKSSYILNEGISQQDLADVLFRRLEARYPDIVTNHGHEVVGDAVSDVASFHAGAEELGSSDIGIMLREILKQLEPRGDVDEGIEDEDDDSFNLFNRGKKAEMDPNSIDRTRREEQKKKNSKRGEGEHPHGVDLEEAMFPDSPIGDKLRDKKDRIGREWGPSLRLGMAVMPGAGAGAMAGIPGALFAPAFATGAAMGAAVGLGGFLTYKGLNWLAQKVFGTKEEALEFAKAHLKAAGTQQPNFEFQGKTYPVKIKSQQEAQALWSKILDLQHQLREGVNEGEGQPRVRKYTKERPDGTMMVRYEVLDDRGYRIPGQGPEGFDDLSTAKKFLRDKSFDLMAQRESKSAILSGVLLSK
jgi:hypothetical protein